MQGVIHFTFAIHEGQTKFHQMAAIEYGGKSALVKQYGAIVGTKTPSFVEANTSVEVFNSIGGAQLALNQFRASKSTPRKGYGRLPSKPWTNVTTKFSERKEINRIFKTKDSSTVLAHLNVIDEPISPVHDDDESDKTIKKARKVPKEVDRTDDPHWGTW